MSTQAPATTAPYSIGVGPAQSRHWDEPRARLGLPVHEYVVQRRVERAKELLVRGELPASQVALEAGFAHQSHMARWMRRLLGVTPTAVARGSRAG